MRITLSRFVVRALLLGGAVVYPVQASLHAQQPPAGQRVERELHARLLPRLVDHGRARVQAADERLVAHRDGVRPGRRRDDARGAHDEREPRRREAAVDRRRSRVGALSGGVKSRLDGESR